MKTHEKMAWMLRSIVEHVAALAQSGEIAGGIVAGIVVEMRAGEHDISGAHAGERHRAASHRDAAAVAVAPAGRGAVPPATVAEMRDMAAMRPAAALAARAGAYEADGTRHLRPVDRVEPAVFGADRHRDSMNHRRVAAKRYVNRS